MFATIYNKSNFKLRWWRMKTKKRLFAILFGNLASDTANNKADFDFGELTSFKHIDKVKDTCRVFYDLAEKYPLLEGENPFAKWHVYYDSVLEKYYALPVNYDKDMTYLGLLTFNANGVLSLAQ